MAGYTYDKDGIRTSKTVNGVRHDYILNGATVLAELWMENGISYGMYFTYDEKGTPATMEYREGDSTALYYYLTDAFGKITGLMDESGTIVCRYAYDGYGNAEAKMTWSGGLLGAVTGAVSAFVGQITDDVPGITWGAVVASAAIGFVEGAVCALLLGASSVVSGIASAVDSVVTDLIMKELNKQLKLAENAWFKHRGKIIRDGFASMTIETAGKLALNSVVDYYADCWTKGGN